MACLGLLKVLKDIQGPMLKVSTSFVDIARITACTGKLVDNI